jgi:hypothetical protein
MTTFAQTIQANKAQDVINPCENCNKYFNELVIIKNDPHKRYEFTPEKINYSKRLCLECAEKDCANYSDKYRRYTNQNLSPDLISDEKKKCDDSIRKATYIRKYIQESLDEGLTRVQIEHEKLENYIKAQKLGEKAKIAIDNAEKANSEEKKTEYEAMALALYIEAGTTLLYIISEYNLSYNDKVSYEKTAQEYFAAAQPLQQKPAAIEAAIDKLIEYNRKESQQEI